MDILDPQYRPLIDYNIAKWNMYIRSRGQTPRPAFYAGLGSLESFERILKNINLPEFSANELINSVRFREDPRGILAMYPDEYPIQQQYPPVDPGYAREDVRGQPQQQYPPVDPGYAREDMRGQPQQQYPPVDPGYAREDVRGQPPQYEQPQEEEPPQYEPPQEEEPPQYEPPQEEEQAPEDEYVYGQRDILPEHRNILGTNGIPVIENPTPQQIAIIRKAYRLATSRLHPDRARNPEQLALLNNALALLNNAYDTIYKERYRGFGLTTKHLLRRRRKYIM